jgi:hypothetical protein
VVPVLRTYTRQASNNTRRRDCRAMRSVIWQRELSEGAVVCLVVCFSGASPQNIQTVVLSIIIDKETRGRGPHIVRQNRPEMRTWQEQAPEQAPSRAQTAAPWRISRSTKVDSGCIFPPTHTPACVPSAPNGPAASVGGSIL